jgi:uncharacterized protein (DUF1501 family)
MTASTPTHRLAETKRRQFLKAVVASGVGGTGLGALDQVGLLERLSAAAGNALIPAAQAQTVSPSTEDYRCLVCLFMYGGNDANNLLIPTDAGRFAQYQRARGVLALPQNSLLNISPANTGGAPFALHPAMTGMQKLFQQGKAAFVTNVGPLAAPLTKAQWDSRSVALPPNLFSHSDQQAQWQSAISEGVGRTGWAGRLADLLQSNNTNRSATMISLAGNNLWENGTTLSSYKVAPSGKLGFDFYKPTTNDPFSVSMAEMLTSNRSNLFEQAWIGAINRSIDNQKNVSAAIQGAQFANAFPGSGIGNQLKMAARLINARQALGVKRQTLFVSIGGFDTHGEDQLNRQNQLFGEISAAVSAFYEATVNMGVANNVTLFSASDFGRNLQSNGKGSDHGWGSHHFVVGGSVKGGNLYGTFPDLNLAGPDDVGQQGVWIPSTAVEQMAATLGKWFGVQATDMPTVFSTLGRFATPDLGFLS